MKYKNCPDGWHPPNRLVTAKKIAYSRAPFRIKGKRVSKKDTLTIWVTYFGVNYYCTAKHKRQEYISEYSRSLKHLFHADKLFSRARAKTRAYLRAIAIEFAEKMDWTKYENADKG
jgi:hypothetical protein